MMMIREKSKGKIGLSSIALKFWAVLLMTLDHMGAYVDGIPYSRLLRLIGRGAAPLFLFIVIQSARKTRRKGRYLLRLYLWSICCGLLNVVVSGVVFQSMVSFSNILQTYVWVVAIAYAADYAAAAGKDRKPVELLPLLGVLLLLGVSEWIDRLMGNTPAMVSALGLSAEQAMLLWEIVRSFLRPVTRVEYGIWFVILGLVWYFLKGNKWSCAAIYCALLGTGWLLWRMNVDLGAFPELFWGDNLYGIACVPFLLLYNGTYGSGHKQFFYFYYILHRYGIAGLEVLLGG